MQQIQFDRPISVTQDNKNVQFDTPIQTDQIQFDLPTTSPNLIPVGEDNSSYVNLDDIFEEYGGPQSLTKEDILADDRLMEVVISSLEARYTPGGALTKARRVASGLSGGDVGGLSGRD